MKVTFFSGTTSTSIVAAPQVIAVGLVGAEKTQLLSEINEQATVLIDAAASTAAAAAAPAAADAIRTQVAADADRAVAAAADLQLSAALVQKSLAESAQSFDGLPLVVDAAGAPVMVQVLDGDHSGLDFQPSKALADRLAGIPLDAEDSFAGAPLVEDRDGNAIIGVDGTGVSLVAGEATRVSMQRPVSWAPDGAVLPRIVGGKRAYSRVRSGQVVDYREPSAYVQAAQPFEGRPAAQAWPIWTGRDEFELVLVMGQSQVYGAGATTLVPARSGDGFAYAGVSEYDGRMRQPDPTTADFSIDGIAGIPASTSAIHNRPSRVIADQINLARAASGATDLVSVIGYHHGIKGYGIHNFMPDHTDPGYWNWLVQFMAAARAHSVANGYELRARYLVWMHGAANHADSQATYYGHLRKLFGHVDALYLSQGFERPMPLIIQGGGESIDGGKEIGVALANLQFCVEGRGVLVTPFWAYRYADNIHPDDPSTSLICETVCKAVAEIEAGRSWTPMNVLRQWQTGNTLFLQFALRPDEWFTFHDPAKYAAGSVQNQGFTVAGGAAITAVEVSTRDTLAVTFDNIALATRLDYALQPGSAPWGDQYAIHRGLIRTTKSWPSRKIAGARLYRWLPSFRLTPGA